MYKDSIVCTQYYNLPSVKIKNSCVSCNTTYNNPNKCYNFILVNMVYNDCQYNNKYFGEEESDAEEKIIKNNSIPLKDNFKDYYWN